MAVRERAAGRRTVGAPLCDCPRAPILRWGGMQHDPTSRRGPARHLSLVVLVGLVASACSDQSPAAPGTDPALAASYDGYLAALDAAHATVEASPFIRDDADRAAGESFVGGIETYALAAALNLLTEQPLLQLLPDPSQRLGFNNPDNLYYVTRVSDRDAYTITGKRGTSTGFLIQAFSGGLPGNGKDAGATTASFGDGDLHLAADGSFAITLSADRPAQGDWLPLRPGTDNLLVRFTFLDWEHEEPGSIAIARIGGESAKEVEITPGLAAAMLDDAARSTRLQAQFYVDQATALTALGPNFLLGPRKAQGNQGTNVQQWNLVGNYDLGDGQALLVKIKDVPQAKYGDFMSATPWLETFEFIHHQVSLDRAQVRVDGDGSIRYVVSARDPGVPNWIDTTGQAHGVLFGRWQEVDGDRGSEYAPTLTVLDLSDLRTALPSDTPTVTPEQRSGELARRRQLLEARFRAADPARTEILRRLHEVERLLGRSLPVQLREEVLQ